MSNDPKDATPHPVATITSRDVFEITYAVLNSGGGRVTEKKATHNTVAENAEQAMAGFRNGFPFWWSETPNCKDKLIISGVRLLLELNTEVSDD